MDHKHYLNAFDISSGNDIYKWFDKIFVLIADLNNSLEMYKAQFEPLLEKICEIDDWTDSHVRIALLNLKDQFNLLESKDRNLYRLLRSSILSELYNLPILKDRNDLTFDEKKVIYKDALRECTSFFVNTKTPNASALDGSAENISSCARGILTKIALLEVDFEYTAYKINSSLQYLLDDSK